MENKIECDFLIIGAGPAGLSCAIRLAQLARAQNQEPNIVILEKGAAVGAHILSGAVFNPKSLDGLLPNWQDRTHNKPPVHCRVTEDKFWFLTPKRQISLPVPPPLKNNGHYIISLSELCQFLAQEAENLGVNIFTGFAAEKLLFNENKTAVLGAQTKAMGVNAAGEKTPQYQPGIELYATQTILAEGARGSLTQKAIKHFELDKDSMPQTYGLGIKEIWEVDNTQHKPGQVLHSVGWPLDSHTYGGSFMYHLDNNKIFAGFVVGLDYENPYLSPFEEFQRFKHHPAISLFFKNGKRISYGARVLNEGGWHALPKLTFPGGLLLGCAAGFLDILSLKGSHLAMQSGMQAAEALFKTNNSTQEITEYQTNINQSFIKTELYASRNVRPAFQYGLFAGMLNAAFETYLFKGKMPWTLKMKESDGKATLPADSSNKTKIIDYPKPDQVLSFDRLSSLALSGVFHNEDQPCHLILKNPKAAIDINYKKYASPETRYCPAGVYEIVEKTVADKTDNNKKITQPTLQINFTNCLHCKACDIKDPTNNIVWTVPEGGGGPNYSGM